MLELAADTLWGSAASPALPLGEDEGVRTQIWKESDDDTSHAGVPATTGTTSSEADSRHCRRRNDDRERPGCHTCAGR